MNIFYLFIFSKNLVEHLTKKRKKDTFSNERKLPFLRRIFDPTIAVFPENYITEWNQQIDQLFLNERVLASLQNYYRNFSTFSSYKLLVFEYICTLKWHHETLRPDPFVKLAEHLIGDNDKTILIMGLSVLEICLLIAIKHHCDIYDNDPFNFEMILTRFAKFAVKSSSMQNTDREMVLKSFENLKYQEFIVTIGDGKVQKEFQMYKMILLPDQVDKALKKYLNLPTEVEQWGKSCII